MRTKIILDTDPGIDDAFAVLYSLHHPKINVLGLTTVHGNVSTEMATNNALILSELSKEKVSVYSGLSKPLIKKQEGFPTFIHGDNGFGNIKLNKPSQNKEEKSAIDFIIESIHDNPHEVVLVAVGPLTNIASAIIKDKSIAIKTKEVILMGGSWNEGGNITEFAEANIFNDPDAADIVFRSPWPITMVGLDVTHKVALSKNKIKELPKLSARCGSFLGKISDFYINFYKETKSMDGCFFHDATALIYLTNPEYFEYFEGKVYISKNKKNLGQTLLMNKEESEKLKYLNKRPNTKILFEVDNKSVISKYLEILSDYMP